MRRERAAHRLGLLAILAACLSVSAANLVSKSLLETVPALPLVLAQLAISSLIVWTLALSSGRLPTRRNALKLTLPGILQPGLVYTLAFAGLAITPVTVEALLFAFETVLVMVIAWPALRERPTPAKLALALIGTVGVLLIAGAASPTASAPLIGIALIGGGVIAAALDTVASRAISIEADPLAMTAASHLGGLVVILAALALAPSQDWAALLDWRLAPALALSGFLLHGLATIAFNFGLARVNAGTAALLFPSISMLTAAGAYVFLGERLGPLQLLGGALILLAALCGRPSPRAEVTLRPAAAALGRGGRRIEAGRRAARLDAALPGL